MPLPVLLAFDHDHDALETLSGHLRARYSQDYRVECRADPDTTLELLTELADRGDEVSLVLAGDGLWQAGAGDGLERIRKLHPRAKRALLVSRDAWTDPASADAIRNSIALGQIDHHVIRPVAGLDEAFHQSVTSFLLEWARDSRLVPQTVHVVGEQWSGRAFELREVLEKCAVPHHFCLADSDRGRELLVRAGQDIALPLVMMPDGSALADPSDAELAVVAGAPSKLADTVFDVVIVGAGPAGLSAAVYGASEGLRTLVVDAGGIGGQARSSSLIRNFLGFPKGISGSLLAEQAYEQSLVFGADFLFMHRATSLAPSDDGLELTLTDDRRVAARSVILATGASYTRLDVPGLETLNGAGVFYGGAAAQAHALSGKRAFVIGGGNSAGQAALHLARYAAEVTILVRGESLSATMSHYLVREIGATPNVEVQTETVVTGGGGDGQLESLVLRKGANDNTETVSADALFVMIGARPHTGWLPPEVSRDRRGFLWTGDELRDDDGWPLARRPVAMETSMPRVLAAGDVRQASVKRVASAVGEGSIAIQLVHGLLAGEQ